MNISINGKAADITIENEKTVGDILSGLEKWLDGSGNRLSGLVIDGVMIGAASVGECFSLEISGVTEMDILVSSWPELAAQALMELGKVSTIIKDAVFSSRGEIISAWDQSPAASFLQTEIPDMLNYAKQAFAGSISASELGLLTEERLRELENPKAETLAMKELINSIISRMTDLPLDMQTGKDGRAAETIQIFSGTAEKLFRLLGILTYKGLSAEDFTVDGMTVKSFNDSFGSTLNELLSAYNSQDTVLIGDLCEYELAPRISKLYQALSEALTDRFPS